MGSWSSSTRGGQAPQGERSSSRPAREGETPEEAAARKLVEVGIGERDEGDDLVMERLPLRGVIGELSDANSLATLALWLQG